MGKNWLYYVIIAKKHRFWLKVKPKSNHKLKNYKKCPSLVGEACEDKPNLRLYGQTLTIYPNPGSELFVCRYGIAPMGIVKYEIYNSIGHLIKYGNKIINHEFIIDLQTFSAGIYFLKVGGNIYKLVKI